MKTKTCELCQKEVVLAYRIKIDGSKQWLFACVNCTETHKHNNPSYSYGGTWKGKRH